MHYGKNWWRWAKAPSRYRWCPPLPRCGGWPRWREQWFSAPAHQARPALAHHRWRGPVARGCLARGRLALAILAPMAPPKTAAKGHKAPAAPQAKWQARAMPPCHRDRPAPVAGPKQGLPVPKMAAATAVVTGSPRAGCQIGGHFQFRHYPAEQSLFPAGKAAPGPAMQFALASAWARCAGW